MQNVGSRRKQETSGRERVQHERNRSGEVAGETGQEGSAAPDDRTGGNSTRAAHEEANEQSLIAEETKARLTPYLLEITENVEAKYGSN